MAVNGCGPKWMDKWGLSRRIKSSMFDWFHEASCDKHDEGYAWGGSSRFRKVCDKKFLAAMLCDANQVKSWRRITAKSQAYMFYTMVRMFGWKHFNYWRM